MQTGALRLPSPDPVADALKVFKSNTASGALSLFYQSLADRVVHVMSETAFLTCQLLQSAASRIRLALLKALAQTAVTITHAFNLRTGMAFAVTVGSNIDNAQVNAKRSINVLWRGFIHLTGREQLERALHTHQIGFAALRLQQFPLAFTADERDCQPPFDRPNGNLSFVHCPGENATIVGDSRRWLERPLHFLVQLVSIGNFRDAADNARRWRTS